MDLERKDGFCWIKNEDMEKIEGLLKLIRESRVIGSLAKTWRLLEKIERSISQIECKNDTNGNNK